MPKTNKIFFHVFEKVILKDKFIEMIQKNKHIKLAGNEKLRIERELPEAKDRAQMVRDVLRNLGQPIAA
jgi:transcription-repair coupling factor (superfamily II helicase)